MTVLLVLAHSGRRGFNGSMFDTAVETPPTVGQAVASGDLYRMGFDLVSRRRNFSSVRDAMGEVQAMLRPIRRGILNCSGFSVLVPPVICAPVRADDTQRTNWLAGWDQRLGRIERESLVHVGRH